MIRDICKDEFFLSQKAEPATAADLAIAQDLLDTLTAHKDGCLSLTGTRKTKRYQTIKVQWQNEQFQTRIKTFTGWTAQIIQHEIDHCEGILI